MLMTMLPPASQRGHLPKAANGGVALLIFVDHYVMYEYTWCRCETLPLFRPFRRSPSHSAPFDPQVRSGVDAVSCARECLHPRAIHPSSIIPPSEEVYNLFESRVYIIHFTCTATCGGPVQVTFDESTTTCQRPVFSEPLGVVDW